jgi:hypothetical protein
MENGAVQRVSLHTDGKPPAKFLVALLPDGKVVRVSEDQEDEGLAWSLMMFAAAVGFCGLGLAGTGVADLVQSYRG